MMVTVAHSDNGRNQLTCIEKDKPKNNNKIRQHEKNKPIFQFLLSFSLFKPFFAQKITIAIVITVPRKDRQQHMQPALSPPFPPPLSIIIVIVMIKIIISIRHAAAANAPLLPPPSPHCRCISKRAAATAKIALPSSCRLCRQAGRRHCAAAATTSANARQLPRYHCPQNKKGILLPNLLFTTMVMTARSNDCGATRQQQWQCCYLQLPRIALML
jgi:hypothetical protein